MSDDGYFSLLFPSYSKLKTFSPSPRAKHHPKHRYQKLASVKLTDSLLFFAPRHSSQTNVREGFHPPPPPPSMEFIFLFTGVW